MDSKPVFVLLTSTTCPSCVNFKAKVWPSLKEDLEKQNKVKVVTIEVPTNSSKPDKQSYHPELSRFIGWFPTMFLFPADRWNNHSSELIGIVKNGKIVPPSVNEAGNKVPEHVEPMGKIKFSKEDTLKWVDFTINNPDGMFKRGSSNHNSSNHSSSNHSSSNHQNNIKPENHHNSSNQSSQNVGEKIENHIKNNQNIKKLPNGNYKVPTAGYYARFEKSKVE